MPKPNLRKLAIGKHPIASGPVDFSRQLGKTQVIKLA
jgi:hypothetical protein